MKYDTFKSIMKPLLDSPVGDSIYFGRVDPSVSYPYLAVSYSNVSVEQDSFGAAEVDSVELFAYGVSPESSNDLLFAVLAILDNNSFEDIIIDEEVDFSGLYVVRSDSAIQESTDEDGNIIWSSYGMCELHTHRLNFAI